MNPTSPDLVVERREQADQTVRIGGMALTPRGLGGDYWSHRVQLSETQAIVAFPKFATVGVGFARETDWNTNLPWTVDAHEIFNHIAHNKGDDAISDDHCIRAIQMVQAALLEDGVDPDWRSR